MGRLSNLGLVLLYDLFESLTADPFQEQIISVLFVEGVSKLVPLLVTNLM